MHTRSAMQVHSRARRFQACPGTENRLEGLHALEPRRESYILPAGLQHRLERSMRLDAIEYRQAQLDPLGQGSGEKHPEQRQQATRPGADEATVLGNLRPPDADEQVLRLPRALQRPAPTIQEDDPRGGFERHLARGELHGLGQASAPPRCACASTSIASCPLSC